MSTYDPTQITFTFAGQLVTGFADGDFVEYDYQADRYALKVGSTGEHAYAKSGDESGTVTVRLLQTSLANDILSALIDVEGELLMRDMGGATLVASTSARLKKPPKGTFGKDIGNREYVFICPQMVAFTGGSAS